MGAVDAYFEFGFHIWDYAAPLLIVREAGGVAMDTGHHWGGGGLPGKEDAGHHLQGVGRSDLTRHYQHSHGAGLKENLYFSQHLFLF